jgi:hypothetical protein
MSQITIYLEPDLAQRMREAAEAEGISQSKWIARLVEERLDDMWPPEVLSLAGSMPDFPSLEEIRAFEGEDLPRDSF